MLRAQIIMAESGPSKKAILAAIGALVLVPAVSLIAVILHDRPEPSPKAASETAPVKAPASAPSSPPPVASPTRVVIPRTVLPDTPPASAPAQARRAAAVFDKLALARRIESTDPKRARTLLREVLQMEPTNEQALEDLSGKLLVDENGAEARELAKRCVAVNARNLLCQRVVQLAIPVTPEIRQMAEITEQCLKRHPDQLDCLYGKVQWLLISGKRAEAKPLIERLKELDPRSPQALMALGRMEAMNGAYREARFLLQAACDKGNEQVCFRADLLRGEGW